MSLEITFDEEPQIGFTLKFLSSCPLPPKPCNHGEENGKLTFTKKIGDTEIKILGDPDLGIPYGRDILAILYLIKIALEQKSRKIIFQSLEHYLNTFKIVSNQHSYEEAKKRFRRIFNATWFYKKTEPDGSEKKFRLNMIRGWHVYFDVEGKYNPLFESYIELSRDFWEIIKKFKIPYDLNAVIELKNSPAILNLYLFLVYRTYKSWVSKKRKEHIKLFSTKTLDGLKEQLSSGIRGRSHFKNKLLKWLDEIKKVWPNCPVYLPIEHNEKLKGRNRSKVYKDELIIEVTNISQLHVLPDLQVELGKALRQQQRELRPLCPKCKTPMKLIKGKEVEFGMKLENYFRCSRCKENFYYKDYPQLYQRLKN